MEMLKTIFYVYKILFIIFLPIVIEVIPFTLFLIFNNPLWLIGLIITFPASVVLANEYWDVKKMLDRPDKND